MNEEEDAYVQPKSEMPGSKQPTVKRVRARSAVVAVFIAIISTALLTAGGLSAAFLLGKEYSSGSIDETRQTVLQEGEVIADVAQKMGPSVVSILTEQQTTFQSSLLGTQTRKSQAAGTGLIIDESGLILTNKHVVSEGTSNVSVVTSDGTKYDTATIVGRDPLNDLAVIKVSDPKNFKSALLGDSDKVRTGQKVIAIGNALGQFQNTVTSGIISGMGRPVEAGDQAGTTTEQLSNLFQTDAAINSGNSGGPLLNYSGEVIGINTAVAADAQNVGFSIPINEAKGIIESVKTTGKLSRPFLGVQFVTLNQEISNELNLKSTEGAFVGTEAESVVAGSPAQKAGIKPGDVITKVNQIVLSEKVPLVSAIGRFKVGDTVTLTLVRDGKEQKLKATLTEAPATN